MEHRLEQAKTDQTCTDDPNDDDLVMKQRILMAKLEDTYYDDHYEDEEGDEGEEETEGTIDRRRRFRRAYEIALATDTQGYQVASTTIAAAAAADRTPQELTAISWAAMCTELLPEAEDAFVRVQALDCDSLLERLKLAAGLLRKKKAKLRLRMEKAGSKFGAADDVDEREEGGSDAGK
jgi:hypothetical protein